MQYFSRQYHLFEFVIHSKSMHIIADVNELFSFLCFVVFCFNELVHADVASMHFQFNNN